ncbi:hypothetical protein [Curtobacterium sp. MCSS17_007]|uniref:hypothetical protein n=1 Tax=Curtobacterium sp. MCSS17_007 TaxID=2175646 RepID=UPI000DA701A5|nr:hypothetical protein [Curtobacterium sp. MCSS17_007]WIE74466.1 hypothetical protein DEJ22_009240 [Curtobacterium sp. MCSS17_007]
MFETILVLAFLIGAACLGAIIGRVFKKLEAVERRKLIEKQMRQQIIDAESERIAAEKILRENGQI